MIKIVVTNRTAKDQKNYQFRQSSILIGRSADCDILLDSDGVSRRHAKIHAHRDLIEIEDLGSGNGTFVNQERVVTHERIPLKKGDQIRIEEYAIDFEAPNMVNVPKQKNELLDAAADLPKVSPQNKFEITDPELLEIKMIKKILGAFDHDKRPGVFVVTSPFQNLKAHIEDEDSDFIVGREPNCGLHIDSQTVSRRHARISKKWGSFTITDLGSKNGTFVNGEQVQEKTIVDGDEIVFGTIKAIFKNPSEFDIESISRAMTEEQKARDKIQEAAAITAAEQAKAGPTDQARLSIVPGQNETQPDAGPPETATQQPAESKKPDADTKATDKTKAAGDKKPDDKSPAQTEAAATDKKDDASHVTKTTLKKKASGWLPQFSAMEYALFAFGLLLIFVLVGMLYLLLK